MAAVAVVTAVAKVVATARDAVVATTNMVAVASTNILRLKVALLKGYRFLTLCSADAL